MRTPRSFSPLILDAWAMHELMFRLGFLGENLFFMHAHSAADDGALALFVLLRADGKEFTARIGPSPDSRAAEAEWKEFVTLLDNDEFSYDELTEIFGEAVGDHIEEVVLAIHRAGITIPYFLPPAQQLN